MKTIMRTALVLCTAMFITSSCEKKSGCTDSSAINFCAECKPGTVTCQYETVHKHVFWFDKATSDSLVAHGYTEISCVNVFPTSQAPDNGIPLVTSVSSTRYFNSAPMFNQKDVLAIFKPLEKGKLTTASYVIADLRDSKENFMTASSIRNWSGTVTINYGDFQATQLIW